MLTEKNEKNKFDIYLIFVSYPGLIIKKDIEIDVQEKNHLLKNFIKNRAKDLLSIEEFRENYGIDENFEESEEIHEHID